MYINFRISYFLLLYVVLQCSGLTLVGCQVLIKASLSHTLSTVQGTRNITKVSWIEIRSGIDNSAITLGDKRDWT